MSTADPKLKFDNNKYTIIPTCSDNAKLDFSLMCINNANLSDLDSNGSCGPNKSLKYLYDGSKKCYGDVTMSNGKNDKGMSASICPTGSSKAQTSYSGVRGEMCVVDMSLQCKSPNEVDVNKKTCMKVVKTPSGSTRTPMQPSCPPSSSLYQNQSGNKRYFCA
jgi:hypothetical protein